MKRVIITDSNGLVLDEIKCDSFNQFVYSTDVLFTCLISDEVVAQFWLMDRIVQIGEC